MQAHVNRHPLQYSLQSFLRIPDCTFCVHRRQADPTLALSLAPVVQLSPWEAPPVGRTSPTTGAVDPRKRKILSTKRAAAEKASRVTKQSPEREARKAIRPGDPPKKPAVAARPSYARPADGIVGRQTPRSENVAGRERIDEEDWREVKLLASQMVTETESVDARTLPLIAECGRPNVGKSTLFNRSDTRALSPTDLEARNQRHRHGSTSPQTARVS